MTLTASGMIRQVSPSAWAGMSGDILQFGLTKPAEWTVQTEHDRPVQPSTASTHPARVSGRAMLVRSLVGSDLVLPRAECVRIAAMATVSA